MSDFDEKFKRLTKSLPSLYKPELNTMIRGLLQAWAVGDSDVEFNIAAAKDQLFTETAGGKYLNRLGSDAGVDRSANLGIDDDTYRELVPVMSFHPKQVRKTIISLLDVFWGAGFTRANIDSGNVETYNFGAETVIGGTVIFRADMTTVKGLGTNFLTELSAGDYIRPNGLDGYHYVKVSKIIDDETLELSTKWEFDPAVNVNIVKGLVRTLDYTVDQRISKTIRFIPSAFADLSQVTNAEIINFINNNPEHSTYITASVKIDPISGDRLNIRTNTPGLQGAIQITGGDANYVTRLNFDSALQTETKASVYEINPNEIVVKIPSSVPVLRRYLAGSAHPRETKARIFSNEEIFNFAGLGANSTLDIIIDGTLYVVNFNHATDFINPSKATAYEVAQVIDSQLTFLRAEASCDESIRKIVLYTTEGSSEYQVTGGTANSILGFGTSLQTDRDIIETDFPSAYIFDPVGQLYTVTGVKSELTSDINIGSVLSYISVGDASSFPNAPGKLLFDFGRSAEEGPISYTSRPNNSTLLIDASHVFEKEHLAGSVVNYIVNQPSLPRVTGDDYPVYITGTSEARQAAQDLIKKLLAAGVVVRFIIEFPEFLFECIIASADPSIYDPDYQGSLTSSDPLTFY